MIRRPAADICVRQLDTRVARHLAAAVAAVLSAGATNALACYGIPCAPAICEIAGAPIQIHAVSPTERLPSRTGGIRQPFAASNIALMSNLPLSAIGGGSGSSLYGWTDPKTRREYAIMGRSNGTAFIDITNPRAPLYVGELPRVAGSGTSIWREPKVYQNTVYIGVDGTNSGMQVMDLTKLRNYQGKTLQLAANTVYNNVNRIHTLAVNPDSGFLYAQGTNTQNGGLHIINVSDPLHPTPAGGYNGDAYTHETQVVTYHGPDTRFTGRELAFNSNGKSGDDSDTFSIVDVTNKSAINRLASKSYTNVGYIHQGWLTEDQRYFFQNDETDEIGGATGGRTRTHLWDVSNLTNPVYKGFYDHATTSADHNLYVKNGFLFETNYTSGLRMLKINDLSSSTPGNWMQEVGYFDTYAADDGATFNGAWNNYPFFESGNIAISDINGGLFIVQPRVAGWNIAATGIGPTRDFGGTFNAVPEPASAALMLIMGFAGLTKRRRAS